MTDPEPITERPTMSESLNPHEAGTMPTPATLRSDGLSAPDPHSSTPETARPSDRHTGPEEGKHT